MALELNLITARQNLDTCHDFDTSCDKTSGNLVLGVNGVHIVKIYKSDSLIARFFQFVLNYFRGINFDATKVKTLREKSSEVEINSSYVYKIANIVGLYPTARKCNNAAHYVLDLSAPIFKSVGCSTAVGLAIGGTIGVVLGLNSSFSLEESGISKCLHRNISYSECKDVMEKVSDISARHALIYGSLCSIIGFTFGASKEIIKKANNSKGE